MSLLKKHILPLRNTLTTKTAVLPCERCQIDKVRFRRWLPVGWWQHVFHKERETVCNGEGGEKERCWVQEFRCERCSRIRRWGFSDVPMTTPFN